MQLKELFGVIADKVADRPGGYVRVIKTGFRQGDGAEMAMIELVDFNDVYSAKSDTPSGGGRKRRRRRRGGGGGGGDTEATSNPTTTAAAAATAAAASEAAEEPTSEEEE